MFSATASHTPRTTSLSAPPFILAATIEILSAHPTYSPTVSTVPGEAESYCARDAMSARGIVLTGDSDLLLFASPSDADWGVVMFRDVHIAFPGPAVSAAVFRPTTVARSLGVDLKFLGFLTQCDAHASFGTLQQRIVRIAERRKSGALVEEYGRPWREFAAAYVLPPLSDAVPAGVEPRIAEILQQRGEQGTENGTKTMFLPFLWEDPTRGSAWDAGRRIRAATYSLLFPRGDGVEEVCRRGQRISAGPVERVDDPTGFLTSLIHGGDAKWWTGVVLNEIVAVFENRGQAPPETRILHGAAHMLRRPAAPSRAVPAGGWTWERIQIYAMAQAAWYSLLLLKEAASAIPSTGDDWRRVVRTLPGVAECIDGSLFLGGIALSGKVEKRAAESALSYYARLARAREEEGEETVADAGSSSGNGNGKRPSDAEPRAGGKKQKKKKRRKGSVRGKPEEQLDSGNMFSALAG